MLTFILTKLNLQTIHSLFDPKLVLILTCCNVECFPGFIVPSHWHFTYFLQDEALSLSVPRQRRRRRKKVEIEAERAAKRRNLMEMVAQLRESHAAEGQAQAMDLTKALHSLTPSASSSSSSTLFPGAMTPSAALKAQMELLQTGGTSRPNGSLLEAELPTRRRRGRRKNVEGLELLFMGSKRGQVRALREHLVVIQQDLFVKSMCLKQ